jgi:hypothetical protein
MAIWAQIKNEITAEIPPDGKTPVRVYADFEFSGKPLPEGSKVKFIIGKGGIQESGGGSGDDTVPRWTEEDVLALVTPITSVQLAGATDGIYVATVENQVVRGADNKLSVRAVASATILPVFDPIEDAVAVVAYSDFDKSGKIERLQPQSLSMTVTRQKGGVYLASVERFDPAANAGAGEWAEVAPMSVGRAGGFCAEAGGKLYVAGGYNGNFTGACEEYDPALDEWTKKEAMPEPRGYGMSASFGGKVYCMGGYNLDPSKSSPFLHAFDPSVNSWQQLSPMPLPASFGSAQVIGGKIYVMAGSASFATPIQQSVSGSAKSSESVSRFNPAVMEYDVSSDSWVFVDVVLASPITTSLLAAAPAGTFGLGVLGGLALPPYGMVTLDRFGPNKEVVFYESYSATAGSLLLKAPLALSHAAGETIHGSSMPENLLAPSSAVDGTEVKLFGGLRYLGSTSQGSAGIIKGTVTSIDVSTGVVATIVATPGLPAYRAGAGVLSGLTYFYGGSSKRTDWQNKTQTFDASADLFAGPAVFGKMTIMRHSMAAAAVGGFAYAAGGAGSGHPPGWLKVTMEASPESIRAAGQATASILIEATDAADDPPTDGTEVLVTGLIYVELTDEEQETVQDARAAAEESTAAVQSTTGAPAKASPPPQKISVLPVLFSSRDVSLIGGKGATVLLERSEDPVREISSLFDFVKNEEAIQSQEDLRSAGGVAGADGRNKTITVGVRRDLYSVAIEATVVDDFYEGTTDTDGAIADIPDQPLASGLFSFSPPPAKQGLSASVSFFSDIASIPDVDMVGEEMSATEAKDALDKVKDEEIPFGASPLYDALEAGADARNVAKPAPPVAPPANIMVAASDNDESLSSHSPSDVIETANSVDGRRRFPVFVTTFVVTDPVSLSARRARTDVADLELISSETGGNSFSVVDASYVQFVIDRIKTSAPSSLGSGTMELSKEFDGYLGSIFYVVDNLAISGNRAELRVEHSMDGYNYEDIGVAVPPNVVYSLAEPVRARFVRYTARLETKTFDSPQLRSVSLDFIRPAVQFVFTFPQQVAGQVSEMAGVSNARLPAGGNVEMGLAHGDSIMFDRDYGNVSQPTIKDRGVVHAVNRSFDTFLGSQSTRDVLETDDFVIYRSKSGPWPQEAAARIFVNDIDAPPEDFLAAPDRGVVAFRRRLSPADAVSLEVILPASFRVGLKVTNPSTSAGILDSFAYMWGTTQDQAGRKINRSPRAVNPFVSPSPAIPGGPLEAKYTFTDPDGDEEDKSKTVLTWYRNGAPIPELANKRKITNSDILAKRADAGIAKTGKDDGLISRSSEWFFTVRPSDGEAFGPLVVAPKVTIVNVPPKASNVKLKSSNKDPSVFTSSDTITADFEFDDIDGDEPSGTIYTWFASGIEVKSGSSNSLGPKDMLNDAKVLTPGAGIRVDVTPSDGDEFGDALASESVSITGSIPKVKDVSILPTKPTAISSLRLTYAYTDVDDLPDQSRISWFRNGGKISELDNIESISTILLAPGQQWYAVVTPFNGSIEGTAVKSNVVVVQF